MNRSSLWISARRVLLLTLAIGLAVAPVLVAISRDLIPSSVYWKTGLILLLGAEVAYGVTTAIAILGTLVLGPLVFLRRRDRTGRVVVARGLLLCVSLLIGFVLAEVCAAVWLVRTHRGTVLPAGAMRGESRWRRSPRILEAGAKVDAPTEFPDPRDDHEIDIVVVGESSAEGVPYNSWVSIGSIVAWQLREVLPNRPTRLHVLATSGETLENQQERLSRLARRPDLLIIYCGHNEFGSRLDAGREVPHYFDEQLPTAWSLLIQQAEASSPLCGLIRETADKCRLAIPPSRHTQRDLIDGPAYTTTEATLLLVDFRRRLEAMVSYAEEVGAVPILIVPAANDAGYEPNRSYLPAATSRGEREAFRRNLLAARRREDSDPEGARVAYRELLARQPGFAESHYRLARLLEQAEAWEDAYRHYILARDLDGFPMRFRTPFQDVYRDVAARHRCILIDSQAYFHAIGRHGLLDDHLFHDAMHPSLRGQIALAQAVLHALRAREAFGWAKDSPAPILDPARCAARFGIGLAAWRYICLWGIMFYDRTYPMRYDPSRRLEKRLEFARAAERINAGEAPEALGLPNVGIPAAVPAVADVEPADHRPAAASEGDPSTGPHRWDGQRSTRPIAVGAASASPATERDLPGRR